MPIAAAAQLLKRRPNMQGLCAAAFAGPEYGLSGGVCSNSVGSFFFRALNPKKS
jgi:hypothetical protein